ncbi:peptidylprolyl isomerase [Psychromonas sp. PT13]|uniref:peptidylprolyl isomerase n=1 Tax=Psychromonas sp. PT13 TaxID=3439547 RepID=UPI003EBA08DC
MKQLFTLFVLLFGFSTFASANPNVVIDTSKGDITIELYPQEAPKTVANFLTYIQKDGYKNTVFHRVIKGFMIQGGGFMESGSRADVLASIENESRNGLSNERGTIAMARTNNPNSATRQFFINQKDNGFLDANNNKWGYAVFGRVTSGMAIVDDIANVATNHSDKPLQAITINSITVQDK